MQQEVSLSLASSVLEKRSADTLAAGHITHPVPTEAKGEMLTETNGAGSAITQPLVSCELHWSYSCFCNRNLWVLFFSSVDTNTSAGDAD